VTFSYFAKRTLSSQTSTKLEIESFENGHDFSKTLTRAKFEELNTDLSRDYEARQAGSQGFRRQEGGCLQPSHRYFNSYPQGPTAHQGALEGINPDEASCTAPPSRVVSCAASAEDVVPIDVSSQSSSPATA
ncbi:ATPase with role in protein import into the ER, partial [Ceratobasidium sp. 370]